MFFKPKKPKTDASEFEKKYPSLSNLLGLLDGNLLSELDYASPEECIAEDAGDDEYWHDIIREGREVLALRSFPWREVALLSGADLQTEREARHWLRHHIALVEALVKIERRLKQQKQK